jgi:hypothetical protein
MTLMSAECEDIRTITMEILVLGALGAVVGGVATLVLKWNGFSQPFAAIISLLAASCIAVTGFAVLIFFTPGAFTEQPKGFDGLVSVAAMTLIYTPGLLKYVTIPTLVASVATSLLFKPAESSGKKRE